MKKNRLIPVLLLKNGWLVQSKGFKRFQNLGNPMNSVKRMSEWASDELIYLDISRDDHYDMRRGDIHHPNRGNILEIIEDISKVTFMPITIGGKITSLQHIEDRLSRGADKVSINTKAVDSPHFIEEAAKEFGSQCIVVSIDVKIVDDQYRVVTDRGRRMTQKDPAEWASVVQNQGAGEIFLNSIDRDGSKKGFDIELLDKVSSFVKIPVIGCGGAGEWSHFSQALRETRVDAVAAANLFQHIDQSVYLAKKHLYDHQFNVRAPNLLVVN